MCLKTSKHAESVLSSSKLLINKKRICIYIEVETCSKKELPYEKEVY